MKLEQIEEPGRLSEYRDPVSGFEFSTYTRDVPRGYRGFICRYKNRTICTTEAKIIEKIVIDGIAITTFEMDKNALHLNFTALMRMEPPEFRNQIRDFDEILPIIIEGWEEYYTAYFGPNQRAKIVLI